MISIQCYYLVSFILLQPIKKQLFTRICFTYWALLFIQGLESLPVCPCFGLTWADLQGWTWRTYKGRLARGTRKNVCLGGLARQTAWVCQWTLVNPADLAHFQDSVKIVPPHISNSTVSYKTKMYSDFRVKINFIESCFTVIVLRRSLCLSFTLYMFFLSLYFEIYPSLPLTFPFSIITKRLKRFLMHHCATHPQKSKPNY